MNLRRPRPRCATFSLACLLSLACAIALVLSPSSALAQPSAGAWCMNPSGQWIPALSSAVGTVYPGTPPAYSLYGSTNGGAAWYALQCDASGNLTPGGTAGGDLSGTYPNPTVAKINGTALSGLATGILKNTTGTGVPSIAVAGTDYVAPPAVSFAGGDVACAHAADTSNANNTITGGTGGLSGTTTIIGTATVPAIYLEPGVKIGVTGGTCSAGSFNANPFVIASTSGTTITLNASTPVGCSGGNPTGGTIFLYCKNQVNDALTANPVTFSNNPMTETMGAGATYTLTGQAAFWSTATAPSLTEDLFYNASNVQVGSIGVQVSSSQRIISMGFNVVGVSASLGIFSPFSTVTIVGGPTTNPIAVSTGAQTVNLGAHYTASGCCSGTYTYVSGGSPSGTGNVTLSGFNNGCTNTAATLAISSNVPGATTFTNTGFACTAIPTTATCTSGTATCSGTMTFSNSTGTPALDGAQGNAVVLQTLKQTP